MVTKYDPQWVRGHYDAYGMKEWDRWERGPAMRIAYAVHAHYLRHCIQPGQRILEIGAGIGNLTKQFIPREFYVASDIDPYAIDYLKTYALGKPYLDACKIDADATEDFSLLRGKFDTVLMVNVLEHVRDENATLKNAYEVLRPGGKIVILVPQFPALYGSLDHVVGHRERYTRQKLHDDLARAGFEIETIFDFNRFSVPSWFVHARIFKRKQLARVQLKTLEVLMPLIRRVDPFIPWGGLSLIAVGKKK